MRYSSVTFVPRVALTVANSTPEARTAFQSIGAPPGCWYLAVSRPSIAYPAGRGGVQYVLRLDQSTSFAQVFGPTVPSALRLAQCWNSTTRDSVPPPKSPSIVSGG